MVITPESSATASSERPAACPHATAQTLPGGAGSAAVWAPPAGSQTETEWLLPTASRGWAAGSEPLATYTVPDAEP